MKRYVSILAGLSLGVMATVGIVSADTLDSSFPKEGDGSSGRPVGVLTDVCVGSTARIDLNVAIHRDGNPASGRVFANGSSVGVALSVDGDVPGGVSLGTGTVQLPADWVTQPKGTTRALSTPISVSFSPLQPGSGNLRVNATASGVSTEGSPFSLSHPVTPASGASFKWTAVDCTPDQSALGLTVNATSLTVEEGSTALNMGRWEGTGSVSLSASDGAVTKNADGTWVWSMPVLDGPAKSTVTITATNGVRTATVQFAVNVLNVSPRITSSSLNVFPQETVLKVGTPVTISGLFADPAGTIDLHKCALNWDDGTAVQSISAGGMGCSAQRTFTKAGVYTVTLQVNDKDGGLSEVVNGMIVVYDPAAGFVTGGGWVMVQRGSSLANPTLEGKANFGFVSKYLKGASVPTGETEFQFKAGSFNFHSSSYQWMVVSGNKAQYKGTGTVNGQPGYGFILTATDGDAGAAKGSDRFRIKVWEVATGTTVFDNRSGSADDLDVADTQTIGGGSIVIHK